MVMHPSMRMRLPRSLMRRVYPSCVKDRGSSEAIGVYRRVAYSSRRALGTSSHLRATTGQVSILIESMTMLVAGQWG